MNELTHADIIRRLDQLEEKLEPMFSAWSNINAMGISLRIVGRGVLWSAGLVVAVMAAYTAVTGGFG
jgi:hypothetical protein